MLTRIATWALGAALALTTVAANAAPPKTRARAKQKTAAVPAKDQPDPWRTNVKAAARPQYRMHPIVSNGLKSTPMKHPVFERGRIERIDDGAIFYSVEVKVEGRAGSRPVQPRGVEPGRVMKMARIYTQGVSPSMIKNRVQGAEVELELKQDPSGFMYVTNITSPSAKTQK